MADDKITGGVAQAGAFRGKGGQALDKFLIGSVSVDPGSIATVTRGSVSVTITGAKAGDAVIMNPPPTLESTLLFVGASVDADDTVTIYLYNKSGGGVDGAAIAWNYLIVSKA